MALDCCAKASIEIEQKQNHLTQLSFLGADKSVLSQAFKNLRNGRSRLRVYGRPSGRRGNGCGPPSDDLFAIDEKTGAERPPVDQPLGADRAVSQATRGGDDRAPDRNRKRYRLQ